MRELLTSHKDILNKLEQIERRNIEQDEKILLIFKFLKQLKKTKKNEVDFKNRKKMGF